MYLCPMFEQSCVLNTCVSRAPNTGMAFLQLLALHVLYAHVHTFSYVRITCYAHVNSFLLRALFVARTPLLETCANHVLIALAHFQIRVLLLATRTTTYLQTHVLFARAHYVCAPCSAHMHTSRYVKCVTCGGRTCVHTYHGELGVRPFVARH